MAEEADLPSVNWFLNHTKISPPPLEVILVTDEKKSAKAKPKPNHNFKNEPIKPPYSYSQLIIMAFKQKAGKKLTLNEIFKFISEEFAFYKNDDAKWKNSVRHLLSLDKRFIKVPRAKDERGKGAFWVLDPKIADSESPLKPYYSSRRRRSPVVSRTKSPKVEEKDVRPHLNPAVVKLLHVLNKRKQENRQVVTSLPNFKPIPSTRRVPSKVNDYNPNFSSINSSFDDKDFWMDHNSYFSHDHSYTSSQTSSPENQDWLIEDLTDACPMNHAQNEFFENFHKHEEVHQNVHQHNHVINHNFNPMPSQSHPWDEGNTSQNFVNNNFNLSPVNDFNDIPTDCDFYDDLFF